MKKMTILCGLPRSGKSTWVQEYKDEGEVVLSADELDILYIIKDFGLMENL